MTESSPSSILIIRPSALGDVCRTVPVLASLREAWPDARIGWLVQEEFSDAVSSHPSLDEVVPFPRQAFRAAWRSPSRLFKAMNYLSKLSHGEWQLAIDCQGLARSGLFARFSGARRRVGFQQAAELGWIFLNDRIPTEKQHVVDRTMDLISALDITPLMDMRLYAPPAAQERWFDHQLHPNEPYIVLAPRSRWASKEWPRERWHELIRGLAAKGHRSFVMVGSSSERDSIDQLIESIDEPRVCVSSLAGRTTVGELMAIIEGAHLVIANDSAPLHIAVGFSRPLIGLFGPTDPAEVGPYGALDHVLRPSAASGSGHDYRSASTSCDDMSGISLEQVLSRAIQVLGVEQ
jgi:lipopolysaccharide heptosyltransferase I